MNPSHFSFDLRAMLVFLHAAREHSFTVAAKKLHMTPSAVSKAIARLEDDLGARLLERTPRAVTATAAGRRFLAEAERLLGAIEDARRSVSGAAAVRDSVRLCLPVNFGRMVVAPRLADFSARHPQLEVELLLVNGRYDPLALGADVALLDGEREWLDSRLAVRATAVVPFALCAAPAYLAARGVPRSIGDLDAHHVLGGIDEKTGNVYGWTFLDRQGEVRYLPRARVLSNAADVLLDMAVAGAGIACLPRYLIRDALRRDALRRVLPRARLAATHFQLVCAGARAARPGVAAILELLAELLLALTRDVQDRGRPTLVRRQGRPASGPVQPP